MSLSAILDTLVAWALSTGVKLLVSAIVLLVSFKLINWLGKKILADGEKKNADKTVLKTFVYVGKIAAKCLVGVCLVGYLGIDTSGITALIASLGVCVGLAVNGALSNLAGGVLILLTRPFKVDDFIEAQGISGTVADIHITYTNVVTVDNKVVHIPNGALSSGTIINYSEKDTRRVDFEFSISYATDFEKAKKVVMTILEAHELVLADPEPFVRIGAHGASALQIKARAWAKNEDYWTVYFDVIESVKLAFDKTGIEIPYNQLDVHVKNN